MHLDPGRPVHPEMGPLIHGDSSQRSDRGSNFEAPKKDSLQRNKSMGCMLAEMVLS